MYAGCMRYPDGGGLTAKERGRREKVRLRAVQMFEQDIDLVQVARQLRVNTKSAYQWRRRWRARGPAPLASRGPRLPPGRVPAAARPNPPAEAGPPCR
jgi:transposase-like protein